MDSIAIGWAQPNPSQTGFLPPQRQRPRYQSNRRIQPFKIEQSNTENIGMTTVRSQQTNLDRSDFAASSTGNMFEKTVIVDAFGDTSVKIHSKRMCSVRVAILTFIIIVILIVATAIAVGIVFATMNSKNSSGGEDGDGTTTNSNQISFSTVSTTVVVSIIISGSGVGPPCTSYTSINDPTRNINFGGLGGSCDNGSPFNTTNGGVWIRFIGSGGTIIPLTPPGVNHCGAFLSTWFNDTLPTTVDPIVNGTVCANSDSDRECLWEVDVSVIYCSGNYYVYFLPPLTVCNSRYCTT